MIATSPDGQWAAIQRGRELSLLAGGAGPAVAQVALATGDADLIFVGPPNVLVVVTRDPDQLTLYLPPAGDAVPGFEPVARLELDQPMRIAAITGPRIALLAPDGKAVSFVRIAGRGLASTPIEAGSVCEFAVGLERNQILLGLHKKLETWDAMAGRPLLRVQLPLPPAPRVVGQAHGHVWAFQVGTPNLVVYRMSDGRPFRHFIGATIDDVIAHASSPLLIVVTARGLVRLHCFAHALTVIEAPWRPGMMLGQLVAGEDIALLGLDPRDDEPWRVAIGGANAPPITHESPNEPHEPPIAPIAPIAAAPIAAAPIAATPIADRLRRDATLTTAADKLRAMRERTLPRTAAATPDTALPVVTLASPPAPAPAPAPAPVAPLGPDVGDPATATVAPLPIPIIRAVFDRPAAAWREPLAAYGRALVAGTAGELPTVDDATELGQLAHRLGLGPAARRALVALYGAYLVGAPALAIAALGHALGDWSEPLGQGELADLAVLRRKAGQVALRAAVSDALDGAPPRAIRVIGDTAAHSLPLGALRVARAGRADLELEAALVAELGRIAVIEGDVARGVLEARLHGLAALALDPPAARPAPWPAGACLLVAADEDPRAPAWLRALAPFTSA